MAVVLRQLVTNLMPSVSGGAYQDTRKVSLVWNDIQNIDACLNSEAERTKRVQALFSPPSFLLREKRWGRRRHVRNDHDGTNPCKQGFLSSVLVSSFPNRKLNLRFGFFYANLQQPLSQPAAASIPTPFVPSGHFPLIGGIGPWEGSLFCCGGIGKTPGFGWKPGVG